MLEKVQGVDVVVNSSLRSSYCPVKAHFFAVIKITPAISRNKINMIARIFINPLLFVLVTVFPP